MLAVNMDRSEIEDALNERERIALGTLTLFSTANGCDETGTDNSLWVGDYSAEDEVCEAETKEHLLETSSPNTDDYSCQRSEAYTPSIASCSPTMTPRLVPATTFDGDPSEQELMSELLCSCGLRGCMFNRIEARDMVLYDMKPCRGPEIGMESCGKFVNRLRGEAVGDQRHHQHGSCRDAV